MKAMGPEQTTGRVEHLVSLDWRFGSQEAAPETDELSTLGE
jgi:hypothetical protein